MEDLSKAGAHQCCTGTPTEGMIDLPARVQNKQHQRAGDVPAESDNTGSPRMTRVPKTDGDRADKPNATPMPGEQSAAPTVRIVLIEDHAILRDGLRALLEMEPGIVVVGEA